MSIACNVDVWLVSLESEREAILSHDEELRAARFRFTEDRYRWIRARSSLREILGNCSGLPATELQFSLGPHGKPALVGDTGIEFSLSHSGSWAMVAVTRGTPVGIDIERIRDKVNMLALLHRLGDRGPDVSTGSHQTDLFRAWTRREAMTKAVGGALLDAPTGDFRVADLDAPSGYAAAVALVGCDPKVRQRGVLVPAVGTE